jgi:F-type H+-transporting ATPase subunit a
MSHGYAFIEQIFPQGNQILLTAIFVAALLAVVFSSVAYLIRRNPNNYIVPDDKFSLLYVADALCSFLLSLSDDVMGRENRKYLPFIATIFIYLLCLNLLSLVPGFIATTGGVWPDNVAFNFGVAIISFIFYNAVGFAKNGFWGYLKHFFGGPELMKPALLLIGLMVAMIEIVSNLVRPLTLSIRLYGNMTGDHLTLNIANDLAGKFLVPIAFYALGTFVCIIQAFVFSLLSMVYIKLVIDGHDSRKEHEQM